METAVREARMVTVHRRFREGRQLTWSMRSIRSGLLMLHAQQMRRDGSVPQGTGEHSRCD
jgi:hypothetical protein